MPRLPNQQFQRTLGRERWLGLRTSLQNRRISIASACSKATSSESLCPLFWRSSWSSWFARRLAPRSGVSPPDTAKPDSAKTPLTATYTAVNQPTNEGLLPFNVHLSHDPNDPPRGSWDLTRAVEHEPTLRRFVPIRLSC